MTTSTKVPVKWGRIIGALIVGLVLAGMAWWWLSIAADRAPEPAPAAQSVSSDDPWGGVPACTDAIADAGGICHGEPTAEPNGLATPTPVPTTTASSPSVPVTRPAPAPAAAAATPAPVTPAPVAPAKPAPPVVVAAPPVESTNVSPEWAHGLPACEVEDDDNCYWDATRGNGLGWSFVTEGGVTSYPVQPDASTLPLCNAADDSACLYQGVSLGDRCDWVNAPQLERTWFFNCDDESLNGVKL